MVSKKIKLLSIAIAMIGYQLITEAMPKKKKPLNPSQKAAQKNQKMSAAQTSIYAQAAPQQNLVAQLTAKAAAARANAAAAQKALQQNKDDQEKARQKMLAAQIEHIIVHGSVATTEQRIMITKEQIASTDKELAAKLAELATLKAQRRALRKKASSSSTNASSSSSA